MFLIEIKNIFADRNGEKCFLEHVFLVAKGQYTLCDLYHRILLYYYAETKEVIYEPVNLKGIV